MTFGLLQQHSLSAVIQLVACVALSKETYCMGSQLEQKLERIFELKLLIGLCFYVSSELDDHVTNSKMDTGLQSTVGGLNDSLNVADADEITDQSRVKTPTAVHSNRQSLRLSSSMNNISNMGQYISHEIDYYLFMIISFVE